MKDPVSSCPSSSKTACSSTAWPMPCATPPMNLPFGEQGVDEATEIVHGKVAVDGNTPGLGVHFGFADVTPVRVGTSRKLRVDAELKSLPGTFLDREAGERINANRAVRAHDPELPVAEFDVFRRRLEGLLGFLPQGFDELLRGRQNGGSLRGDGT